jgi:hypothetical protein
MELPVESQQSLIILTGSCIPGIAPLFGDFSVIDEVVFFSSKHELCSVSLPLSSLCTIILIHLLPNK